MTQPLRVMSIVGARPNFMKIAPIVSRAGATHGALTSILVHTGQHYDDKLSRGLLRRARDPAARTSTSTSARAVTPQQTAAIMAAFEPVLLSHRPDVLIWWSAT